MKVLLDHNIPIKMCAMLLPHELFTARQMHWERLNNGALLKMAEEGGFNALVTADQSIFYQQNNRDRAIALIVLSTNDWEILRCRIDAIAAGGSGHLRVGPSRASFFD